MKFIYLLFAIAINSSLLLAQTPVSAPSSNLNFRTIPSGNSNEPCGFDQRHQQLMQIDPSYLLRVQANEFAISQKIRSNRLQKSGTVDTIPVVVHIIHSGQAVGTGANISLAQINSAISALNARYQNSNNQGVDVEIHFELAKRDPNGNATSGINRIDGSVVSGYSTAGVKLQGTVGASENSIKDLSRWPNTQYYNVWVISEIDDNNGLFGIQGFAYFPGASPSIDGTMIMHTCFGTTGTVNSFNNQNRTFVHELGHGLNLYHTFQGDADGTTCPSGSGDLVADTDPHIRAASNCPSGTNSCTGNSIADETANFMNYSSQTCAIKFTAGQKTRMQAGLDVGRPSLITSLGNVAPSASSVVAATCTPSTSNTSNTFGLGIYELDFSNVHIVSDGTVDEGDYIDQTKHQIIEVKKDSTYPITIKTGPNNNENVKVFIDFNNDGDFADAGETVFSSTIQITHNGSITIPASSMVVNTLLRMRIISDFQSLTITNSCYGPTYGQIEDYALMIKEPPTLSDINLTLSPPYCGLVNANPIQQLIVSNIATNATAYRFRINGGSLNNFVINTGANFYFNLNQINGINYGVTYAVEVAAFISGNWTSYGTPCNISTTSIANAVDMRLRYADCGATNVDPLSRLLVSNQRSDATAYRFRINGGSLNNFVINTAGNFYFNINQIGGIAYGTTYTIEVAALISGSWTNYGTPCTITTSSISNAVNMKLRYVDCIANNVDPLSRLLVANQRTDATAYRFRINGGILNNFVFNTGSNFYFNINQIAGIAYGTSYTIEVAAFIGGNWTNYGTPCNIATTTVANAVNMRLRYADCGASNVDPANRLLVCNQRSDATAYRFRINGGSLNNFVINTAGNFYFNINQIGGIANSTTYTIEAAALISGSWTNYGTPCNITTKPSNTPSSQNLRIGKMASNEAFNQFNVFPNPLTSNSTINIAYENTISLSSTIDISIYSIQGQLLHREQVLFENQKLEYKLKASLFSTKGVYLIQLQDGDKSFLRKIVVH